LGESRLTDVSGETQNDDIMSRFGGPSNGLLRREGERRSACSHGIPKRKTTVRLGTVVKAVGKIAGSVSSMQEVVYNRDVFVPTGTAVSALTPIGIASGGTIESIWPLQPGHDSDNCAGERNLKVRRIYEVL
jgi:hypothetical protein